MTETIFQRVTRQIVESIEAGAAEFHMPRHGGGSALSCPRNAISGRAYRGVNILSLWLGARSAGFDCGEWATYRQWSERGGQVRKGERGCPVVFWKRQGPIDEAEDSQSNGARFIARAYTVFNVAQVDGWSSEPAPVLSEEERLPAVDAAFAATEAKIEHGAQSASYSPLDDCIRMPTFGRFRDADAYYAVLAHEVTHWTGAKHRLDRQLTGRFGSAAYAMEELVAELGAAFTCARLGISGEPRPDHAAYLASWLRVLRGDPRAIFTAAGKAQEAVDYAFDPASVQSDN